MIKNKEANAMTKNKLEKEIEGFLCHELKEHENSIGCMLEDEREGLREWVASGNSAHDNPFFMAFYNGGPMDYISAVRACKEVYEQRAETQHERQDGVGGPEVDKAF